MQRLLICGDRLWSDRDFFFSAMQTFIDKHGVPEVVIEGCARGADTMAGHDWAEEVQNSDQWGPAGRELRVEHFPAMWNEHDSYGQACWCKAKAGGTCRGAGPLRNQAMLDAKPDAVIAFHADLAHSRGTADMVRRARAAGIPVWIPVVQPTAIDAFVKGD